MNKLFFPTLKRKEKERKEIYSFCVFVALAILLPGYPEDVYVHQIQRCWQAERRFPNLF